MIFIFKLLAQKEGLTSAAALCRIISDILALFLVLKRGLVWCTEMLDKT